MFLLIFYARFVQFFDSTTDVPPKVVDSTPPKPASVAASPARSTASPPENPAHPTTRGAPASASQRVASVAQSIRAADSALPAPSSRARRGPSRSEDEGVVRPCAACGARCACSACRYIISLRFLYWSASLMDLMISCLWVSPSVGCLGLLLGVGARTPEPLRLMCAAYVLLAALRG